MEAYVDGDTYSSGPVHLKLRITQMPVLMIKAKMLILNWNSILVYIL